MPLVLGKLTNVHCEKSEERRKIRAGKMFGPGSSLMDIRQNVLKYDVHNIPVILLAKSLWLLAN